MKIQIFYCVVLLLPLLFDDISLANELTAYELAKVFSVEDNAERLDLLKKLYDKSSQYDKFLLLPSMSKTAIMTNNFEVAQKYSNELFILADQYKDSWNYGNAIHDANMVFGLVALNKNNTDDAKDFLLKAGKTPGSPQLNNFGPNLLLAKALLEIGEAQTVLKYFQLLTAVWKRDDGRLKTWISSVKGGGIPYLENHLTR